MAVNKNIMMGILLAEKAFLESPYVKRLAFSEKYGLLNVFNR